jgi:hypothetical protein
VAANRGVRAPAGAERILVAVDADHPGLRRESSIRLAIGDDLCERLAPAPGDQWKGEDADAGGADRGTTRAHRRQKVTSRNGHCDLRSVGSAKIPRGGRFSDCCC